MASLLQTQRSAVAAPPDQAPLVLLVDDNTSVRQACAVFCERYGYRVVHADDSPEALEKAFRYRPDVIVLDLVLPTLPGWDVATALRRDPRTAHIPILATSGLAADDAERKARAHGVTQFLAKPFDGRTLVERIRRLLEP
jgi:CheY-like chemotaxis protein